MNLRMWLCGIVLLLAPAISRADGLLYQLPEDKQFVKYDLEMDLEGQGTGYAGSLLLKSVGQTVENGEKCRWIEVDLTIQRPDVEQHSIFKVLLPEKNLKDGVDPLQRIVKGWFKRGEMPVEQFTDPATVFGAPLSAFLAGPLEGVKQLDKQFEDSKLGNLECDVITGTRDLKLSDAAKIKLAFHTFKHEKAPFGVVRSELKFELLGGDQAAIKGVMRFKLAEVGTTATSALPDAQ